jgi:malonate decarboxylase epsilon subunit
VVGLDERRVAALASGSVAGPAYVANLNAPTQFVLAGSDAALEDAVGRARAAGASRAERLAVSVPSHSPLLAGVAEVLAAALRTVPVTDARVPYVTNVRARATRDREAIREDLARSVALPVRWHDATVILFELGARLFVELPPGRTLTGLAQEAFPCARAVATDEVRMESIAALAARARVTP